MKRTQATPRERLLAQVKAENLVREFNRGRSFAALDRATRRLLRAHERALLEAAAERMEQAMTGAPSEAWEEGPHRPHHLRRVCWAAIMDRRAVRGRP